jgi:hypothetical protein
MNTQSGFRPDQEAMISEQYLDGGSLAVVARAWHTSTERIRAALEATGTPLRKRGGQVGHAVRVVRDPELEARDARIIALARDGWGNYELADEFGMTYTRICQILKDVDIPIRREAAAADEVAVARAVIERYRAGDGIARMSRDLKIGHPRINRILDAAGIERRPQPPSLQAARRADEVTPHNPAPTAITTRKCHECNVYIPEIRWPKHMAEVHGVVSKNQKQLSSVDLYLERVRQQPEVEPQRQPEPPCPVCGLSPCPTPIVHARTARTWAQRGYQPRKKGAA